MPSYRSQCFGPCNFPVSVHFACGRIGAAKDRIVFVGAFGQSRFTLYCQGMPTGKSDVLDPDRLIARWLFELQQSVSKLADRNRTAALTCWAAALRTQLAHWATSDTTQLPCRPKAPLKLTNPLDAWLAGRLVASAKAPDAVAGLAELGWSSQTIANAHGEVSDSAVQDYVRRIHSTNFNSHWKSPPFIEAVQAAHEQGFTPRTIASRVDTSRKLIERIVDKNPGPHRRRLDKKGRAVGRDSRK